MPDTPLFGPSQPKDAADIEVSSGVSAFTESGFVTLQWGAQKGQLTPSEARQHGLSILSAADAAESDAAVFAMVKTMFTENGDATDAAQIAARVLLGLREERAKRAEREESES